MIKSMTGFGRANLDLSNFNFECEIRSVNHRYCDISVRLPNSFYVFETQIRNLIQKRIDRGKISIFIALEENREQTYELTLNEDLLDSYLAVLNSIKSKYDIKDSLSFRTILSIPNLIERTLPDHEPGEYWEHIENVINRALDNLDEMRLSEGNYLANDLKNRIEKLNSSLEHIKTLAKERFMLAKQKMRDRIQQLLDDVEADENRLAMEIAIMSDKLDITEECVRFMSHNQQFLAYMGDDEPVGRRLNFLLQEMNREANTIASKANYFDITQIVVEMKEEIERIREQIQNIE